MYSDSPVHHFCEHNIKRWNVWYSKQWMLVLCSVVLAIVSCNQNQAIQQEGLYGKWDIHRAMRNGAETHYLRGGYLIIESNGEMKVNITGAEEKSRYVLDDNRLRLDNEKEFMVESFRQDSMTILYEMNTGNTYRFYLTRKMNENH